MRNLELYILQVGEYQVSWAAQVHAERLARATVVDVEAREARATHYPPTQTPARLSHLRCIFLTPALEFVLHLQTVKGTII